MKHFPLQSRYRVGSVVMSKSGYIRVKIKESGKGGEKTWTPESHLVAQLKDLPRPDPKMVGKPIQADERVFHITEDKRSNRPENLVVIKIRLTKYDLLPTSRCLYIPSGEDRTIEEALSARGLR